MKKQKAFTLIELMVVIALMGLIATIVLVSLRGARERARIAASLQFSNSLRASLSDALVSWWNFNEGTGNTVGDIWEGNTGTLGDGTCTPGTGSCPDWTRGVVENALSFDGVDDYVSASGSSLDNIANAITFELWFRTSFSQSSSYLLAKGDFLGVAWALSLDDNSTTLRFFLRLAGGGFIPLPASGNFDNDQWYHVVGTFDGRSQRIYINGALANSFDFGLTYLMATNNRPLGIGASSSGLFNNLGGIIDEVRIYNRGLTALEIQKRYAEGLNKFKLAEK